MVVDNLNIDTVRDIIKRPILALMKGELRFLYLKNISRYKKRKVQMQCLKLLKSLLEITSLF